MDISAIMNEWLASFLLFFPKLIAAIVIFILTLLAASIPAKAMRRLASRRIKSPEVLKLIKQISQWTVVIIGTVVALDQVDFNVTGFVAGLGIAGFTIGFALQDIARNFISGLILLYRQPFKIGDFIEVSGHTGTVKMINIRDTEIQTLDGDLVIIPNNKVFENPIINMSTAQLRRRTVRIGLGYEEDVDRAMDIFLGAIQAVAGVENEPAPMIQAMSMDDSSLSLTAFYWVDQKENSPLRVHSEVLKAVNRVSHEHHINLPYPIQTVLVQQSSANDAK
ncbi:MAG: mechanosensitive ion channel [Brevefilum sp.]|nr:mechanosensitive ion channel [Brevefilum sp.]